MTRILASVACLTAVACTGSGAGRAVAPEDDGPRTAMSFIVRDSMDATTIAGATVRLDDRQGTTDAHGRVTLDVRGGERLLTVQHEEFDRLSRPVAITRAPATATLDLRPAAPFVKECLLTPSGIRARVVDLAGRKTILRRNISYLDMLRTDGIDRLPVVTWKWYAVDDITYEVLITYVPPDLETVKWFVYDRERHVRPQQCTPTPECQDCVR